MKEVCLIQVPYMIGDERHGASKGPRSFVEARAQALLGDRGLGVRLAEVERGEPFRDSASASLAVSRQLAAVMGRAVEAGRRPLVMAGPAT
jgi:arginase family enzyme